MCEQPAPAAHARQQQEPMATDTVREYAAKARETPTSSPPSWRTSRPTGCPRWRAARRGRSCAKFSSSGSLDSARPSR